MNKQRPQLTIWLVATGMLGLAIMLVMVMINSSLKDEIEVSDVVFEIAGALMSLALIAIFHRTVENRRIHTPLVVGFALICVTYFKDLLDEFARFPYILNRFEHAAEFLGLAIAGIGLYNWVRLLRTHALDLEEKVEVRTANLKESNRRLKVALTEKNYLIREVHHRVKNNLQVVESLLRLQQRTPQRVDGHDAIGAAYSRIRSISTLHELLYRDGVPSNVISIPIYFRTLIHNLRDGYGVTDDTIQLSLHSDDITLDVDRSILCGLLVNELVTNAITHAFPGAMRGEIVVGFHKNDKTVELSIVDNGVGLPADFRTDSTTSLGYRLIHVWIRQLEAEMRISGEQGTSCWFAFNSKANSRESSAVRN